MKKSEHEMAQIQAAGSYDAVLFDLLTAVLDSWSLWNAVAGDASTGMRWRQEYLELTYGQGTYVPYESLVARAASNVGLPEERASDLAARWTDLTPWPEAAAVVKAIARDRPVGVVTNCSELLGRQAAARVPVDFATVVTAERAGAYKPRPETYRLALAELDVPAPRVLFVAGSKFDLPGASGVGMHVWWHNRVGMTAEADAPAPVGQGTSLSPLLELLGIAGAPGE